MFISFNQSTYFSSREAQKVRNRISTKNMFTYERVLFSCFWWY